MVWACAKEPIKSYIEGLNSGMGLMCGVMTGFVRIVFSEETTIVKFTPADYVINATVASAWKRSTEPPGHLLIFNCTEHHEMSFSWKQFLSMCEKYIYNYPPYEKLLWYPRISMTSNKLWRTISVYTFQIIPALFLDAILFILRKKTL